MRVTVKKWGNSAALRLPSSVMAAARLRLDQAVDVREENGRIVVEPAPAPVFDLDRLIGGITDKNRHEEADFGGSIGKEVW